MKKSVYKLKKIFYKALFKINFLNNGKKYFSLYQENKIKYYNIKGGEIKEFIDYEMAYIANTAIPALSLHKEVFSKYKNINAGKDIVIMGSGDTLNKYEPIKDAIHIGVNSVFKYDKVKLDYLFLQDFSPFQKEIDEYEGNNCKKFYGIHQLHYWQKRCRPVPESSAIKANAERYFFNDLQIGHNPIWGFVPDITLMPLTTYSSVIFPALQFALFTNPKRIYIVGCDCAKHVHFSNSTLYGDNCEDFPSADTIIYGWKKAKIFINNYYPDIEIISINPVGLKNLFKNEYTDKNEVVSNKI